MLGTGFKEVTFDTLSMNGEPFEEVNIRSTDCQTAVIFTVPES